MPELERVLYVEDDADIREIARLSLEVVGGFSVRICADGRQAIRDAPAFRPDLILLDVMMPGLDGPATLLELRKYPELAKTPVVFMTAKVQHEEVQEYLERGAAHVIAKPFDPMSLPGELREVWERCHG